jgi:hypothetical protein
MSSGGTFKLIANDGKADRMIMATELINQRIKDIMCLRARQGYADPTPTLVDIERTHLLFVNAHFKPFCAIGYEYNKVKANTGNAQFGGSTTFSIPQFGDFFNDMVVNVSLDKTSATAGTVPAFPDHVTSVDQFADASIKISAKENAAAGVYTTYTYQYVDAAGNVKNVGSAAQNYVRYAEYPGQRLFKKVKFEVNGNPLDDYDTTAYVFHQKFKVAPNKLTGWKRLVGQEVPLDSYSDLSSVKGVSSFPDAITDLLNVSGANPLGAPLSAAENTRKVVQIVNGPQTPKEEQPILDLWIPLRTAACA